MYRRKGSAKALPFLLWCDRWEAEITAYASDCASRMFANKNKTFAKANISVAD